MSEDPGAPVETQAGEGTEGGKPAGRKWVKMLLLIAGLSVGGSLGVVLIGPALGARLAAGESEGGGGGGHGGGHGAVPELLHTIDHLVVNPAGTEGRRFLLVSVAMEPADGATDRLKSLDPELRAAIIPVLASRDVGQLLDLELRAELIADVTAALESVAGDGTIVRVLFPEFVVQ